MEMSNASDPDRIPSSVFTRTKSTTQKDWSVASNESLFSIHVGNSSLSRDHVLGPVEHLPMSTDSGLNRAGIDAEQVSLELTAAAAANAEAMKDVLPEHAEEHAKKEQHSAEEGSTLPTNSLYRSDESFAFPINRLTGERSGGSLKAEPGQSPQVDKGEQLPLQTGTPKAAPAAGEKRWFLLNAQEEIFQPS
ncbi:uncharacterized protein LOC135645720 [Musa acuminata AAA Group]|uniref:uncharacterized protein LOC135645720 n=1 Tax=Musa acuminata AAA Group TaxID=214697 RepID=UPI0031DCF3FD